MQRGVGRRLLSGDEVELEPDAERRRDLLERGNRRIRARALKLRDLLLRDPDTSSQLGLGESCIVPRPTQTYGHRDLGIDVNGLRA